MSKVFSYYNNESFDCLFLELATTSLHFISYFSIFKSLESKMVTTASTTPAVSAVNPREKALEDFRKKIMEHKEIEARLKQSV